MASAGRDAGLLRQIERVFRRIDLDGNGNLDRTEVIAFLKTCGISEANKEPFMKKFEVGGDGAGKLRCYDEL